jgi:hypothetical protein
MTFTMRVTQTETSGGAGYDVAAPQRQDHAAGHSIYMAAIVTIRAYPD